MNLMPFIISWAALATVVLALAIYRYFIARGEDDYIHVGVTSHISTQQALAKKLDAIDRWGKLLTIAVAVYALVIGGLFMYSSWVESGTKIQ
jgi:hypothetical protein